MLNNGSDCAVPHSWSQLLLETMELSNVPVWIFHLTKETSLEFNFASESGHSPCNRRKRI